MKEPKDKRTKEYKIWKQAYGLGDLVEDITKASGIKKLVGDCKPCEERKKKWNEITLFRKSQVLRCLTDEQTQQYKTFIDTRKQDAWQPEETKLLIDLYAHVFAIQYDVRKLCVTCAGTGVILKQIQDKLDKVYNS